MPNVFSTLKQRLRETSLDIFLYVRRILGSYCPTSDSRGKRLLLKCYCVAVTTTPLLAHLWTKSSGFLHVTLGIEFVTSLLFSLITPEKGFIKFCNDIQASDTVFGIRGASLIPGQVVNSAALIFTFRLAITILKYIQYYDNFGLRNINILFMLLIKDVNHLSLYVILALFCTRMKVVRGYTENYAAPVNIIGQEEIAKKIKQVRKSMFMYSYLLDKLNEINSYVQYMETKMLISSLPISVLFMYRTIRLFILQITNYYDLFKYAFELMIILLGLSIPAILAQMTINEVDNIKNNILTQLLRCSDESLRFELTTALQYVTLRPFKLILCRCVPLDSSLLVGLITIIITYVVVVIQFSTLQ